MFDVYSHRKAIWYPNNKNLLITSMHLFTDGITIHTNVGLGENQIWCANKWDLSREPTLWHVLSCSTYLSIYVGKHILYNVFSLKRDLKPLLKILIKIKYQIYNFDRNMKLQKHNITYISIKFHQLQSIITNHLSLITIAMDYTLAVLCRFIVRL